MLPNLHKASDSRGSFTRALLLVVLLAVPLLFRGLAARDLENDEAIYSYVVDQMLATGDWLDFANPYGGLFHEKPPLKFWIVAGGIAAGLPHNEIGLRLWDPVFALAALVYLTWIGQRLGGVWCGLSAALLLLLNQRLLFEHGVRSNNMESMLVLGFCAGTAHFIAWSKATTLARRTGHAIAVTAAIAFCLLGKFVAAAFLPMTLGTAVLVCPNWRTRARQDLRLWIVVGLLGAVLSSSWFVFAHQRFGPRYFEILFGDQVFQRFTSYLEPHHLKPWYFYFHEVWTGLASLQLLVIAGALLLVHRFKLDRSPEAVVVAVWATLPLAVLSCTTSKLYHYAYPFLPPIMLIAGYAVACLIRWSKLDSNSAIAALSSLQRSYRQGLEQRPTHTLLVLGVALVCSLVAVVTLSLGPLAIQTPWGLLRSSGIVRPLVVAALALGLLFRQRRIAVSCCVLVWIVTTFFDGYRLNLDRAVQPDRTVRDLVTCLEQHSPVSGPRIVVHFPENLPLINNLFYYVRQLPYGRSSDPSGSALVELVTTAEAAIFVWDEDWPRLQHQPWVRATLDATPRRHLFNTWLLLPGPYAACVDEPAQ